MGRFEEVGMGGPPSLALIERPSIGGWARLETGAERIGALWAEIGVFGEAIEDELFELWGDGVERSG